MSVSYLGALMTFAEFDAAVAANLTHGAMTGADPLVEALYAQLEAPAAEGAHPPSTARAGLTAQQRAALAQADAEPWLYLAMAVGAVVAVVASACSPLGFAA